MVWYLSGKLINIIHFGFQKTHIAGIYFLEEFWVCIPVSHTSMQYQANTQYEALIMILSCVNQIIYLFIEICIQLTVISM